MDFLLDPPVGVNGLSIGATANETAETLQAIGDVEVFRRTEDDTSGWVMSRASGLTLFAYLDTDRHLEAVEFASQPGIEDRVLYQGISLFDHPADDLVAQLRQATVVINSDEEPEYAFTAPNLLLAFWRSTVPEGADDPEGRFFEGVLLARPGYYDR
jgi:hypothetical protein